jgi:pimeloyl-ACP methyl ester carboxylesterase
VSRVALTAPAAPYAVVGHDAFTAGMNDRLQAYFEAIAIGEGAMSAEFGAEDAALRAGASAEDPDQAWIFEQTRQGLGGWIDDEIANASPWGFEVESIRRPTSIWYDPDDTTLPHQHAEWLAAHIEGADLVVTHSLGHGSAGNPREDWRRLYAWLIA